jgi:hypothetical protein
MQIHGLMLVKNEEDIIAHTLTSAAKWCDYIYVLDNDSSDCTWDIVNELARTLPQVVPFQQAAEPYENSLRRKIVRHYFDNASEGDWWHILDADEICIDDPPSFLSRVPPHFKAVWKQEIAYSFTEADLAKYESNPMLFEQTPIEQRFRYYCADYSEMRFFRHSATIGVESWGALSPVYPKRVRIKHFQYRSPAQIQKRLDTRREIIRSGRSFLHESRSFRLTGKFPERGKPLLECDVPLNWEERIVSTAKLHYDNRDGNFEGKAWSPPD